MKRKSSASLATVIAPVTALMVKAPFTLPLVTKKNSGKPCGSVAEIVPTMAPGAAFSGTLKADAVKTGGRTGALVLVALADEVADEVAVAVAVAEAVAEVDAVGVEAPDAKTDAVGDAEGTGGNASNATTSTAESDRL